MNANPYMPPAANVGTSVARSSSSKRYAVAVCLSAVFGILGVQHFYLGRYALGALDLGLSIAAFVLISGDQPSIGYLLLAIDGLHTFIVTILLLVGAYKDGTGKLVCYPGQNVTNK